MDGCQQFLVADLENGQVKGRSYLESPAQQGSAQRFSALANLGITRLITTDLDPVTKNEFQQNGIRILEGATGSPESVLGAYVTGDLRPPEQNR